MSDYVPVDLSPWCNVGPAWVGPGATFPSGLETLRGLPFRIGSEGEARFIGFGPEGYKEPIEVPIGTTANWVILAQRVVETRILEGEPAGHLIAVYRFRFEDGTEVEVPMREFFEIGPVLDQWAYWPLLAVPDQPDSVYGRDAGPWDETGERQCEAIQGTSRSFVLWAWRNPHPERPLAALRVEPRDRRFLIGAMTLSSLEEDPFGRQPRRPVKITLLDPERAARPFSLDVKVDRGLATYAYPLPDEPARAFLAEPLRSWGEPYHDASSPSYVEIAAQPSATVHVRQDAEELAAVAWGELSERGKVETPRARLEIVDPGKNWVHVRVLDDETGEPVACRVAFRSPEGIPYQPHGHHDHLLSDKGTWHIDVGGDVRLGHVTYAYVDGRCQGWLPRGQVLVEAARGFEYEPLRTAVTIEPGQRELTLRLKRWKNMNAERWFSGDSHVHFLSTPGATLEAAGEDLNVVNLLQAQWGHLFTNTEDFVGRPVASRDGRTIVYTGQENRQHMLGHLILMGLKEPVMPWSSDGPSEAELGGTLETTLSHWADACHAQGGTVVSPHFPLPNGEPAALVATGRTDAIEMLVHQMHFHQEYYRYLNGGYRLPLVGGTDKMTADVPVGLYRTYVHLAPDEEFTYENWCKNLRLGRTFLSGGPLLRFTVDGAEIGDTVTLSGNGGTVEVEAEAESIFPVHSLQIVQEGRVVASTEEPAGARRLHLRAQLKIDRHTWLAARAGGPGYVQALPHHDGWQRGVMAHTSPIYVAVGEPWWMFSAETAQYMLTLLHGGVDYIRQRSRQHPPGSVLHPHGEEDHLAYLERPFHEAIAAVHRHVHEAEERSPRRHGDTEE